MGLKLLKDETQNSYFLKQKTRNFFWGLNASDMSPTKFGWHIDDVRFGSGKYVDPTNLFTDDATLKI